jgi:ribosomal protein S18 acetylase RimI-like enzyme
MTDSATPADVPPIRSLLAAAYHNDPLSAWMFPDPTTRPHAIASWFGLFVEQYIAGAHTSVIRDGDELVAVALWRLPDDTPLTSDGVPGIAGLLDALAGPQRGAKIADGLHGVEAVVPDQPHAYLNFIAVAQSHRRQGLGRQVFAPLFDAAESAGLFVHLETTDPANWPFYDALGFEETARLAIGGGKVVLRAMRRGPD